MSTEIKPLTLLRNYIAIPVEITTKTGIIITINEKKQAHSFQLTNEVAFVSDAAEKNWGITPGSHVTLRPTASAHGKIPFDGKDYLLVDASDVMAVYSAEQVEKEKQYIKDALIVADKEKEIARKASMGLLDADGNPTTSDIELN